MKTAWKATVIVLMLCACAGPVTVHAATLTVDTNSPAAGDGNAGTTARPFKTVAAACAHLKAGDHVIVKGGLYRENFVIAASGTAQKPIVVEGAPGEKVILSGSDLVKGWTRVAPDGPIWAKTPWQAWKGYGKHLDHYGDGRAEGPELIVDNSPLVHVASRDGMFPGSYCYDESGEGTIFLWMLAPRTAAARIDKAAQWWDNPVNLASGDPNDHQVEAAVRPWHVHVTGSYVTVRNFTTRYDMGHAQESSIHVGSAVAGRTLSYDTVEGCTVEWPHGSGIGIEGDHMTVRRCYIHNTGGEGAGGLLTNSLFEDNVLDHCTFLGDNAGWENGGMKMLFTVNTTVRRCVFTNNDGPGFWFDTNNSGDVVEDNFCSYNQGAGIMMEVSPYFPGSAKDTQPVTMSFAGLLPKSPAQPNVVRNNVCVGNVGDGILLQLASDTIVANNTVCDNTQYGIFVRYHPYCDEHYACLDNTLINNLCVDNGTSQVYMTPLSNDKPGFIDRNHSDYNLFFSTATWLGKDPITQDWKPDKGNYQVWSKTQDGLAYSVEEMFKMYGREEHSVQNDPLFVAASDLDFHLMPSSPAIGAGIATPYVETDYLGRPRPKGRAPSIGALEYFPAVSTVPTLPMYPSP